MRHQRQEQIKKTNDMIAISAIINLVKADRFKDAIDIAERRKFTPVQFGEIANMTELTAEEIYQRVF